MQSEFTTVIDYETIKITNDNAVPKYNPAWSKDGSMIVFSQKDSRTELESFSLNGESNGLFFSSNDNARHNKFVISPDGKELAYCSQNTGYLTVVSLEDGSERILAPEYNMGYHPAWSYDGNYIAFQARTEGKDNTGQNDIYIVTASGGDVRKLTEGTHGVYYCTPSWSPDGKAIVCLRTTYTAEDSVVYDIVIIDIENGTLRKISTVDSTKNKSFPVWSPNDSLIAFISYGYKYDSHDIWLIPSSGGEEVKINNNFFFDVIFPVWSPDGSKIAFYGRSLMGYGIYVLDLESKNEVLVTKYMNTHPMWSSDGNSIVIWKWDTFYNIEIVSLADSQIISSTHRDLNADDKYPIWINNDKEVLFIRGSTFCTIPFTGGEVLQLTSDFRKSKMDSDISPDGTKFVYSTGSEIFVMQVEGGDEIYTSKYINENLSQPTWSPDGKRIACKSRYGIKIFTIESDRLYETGFVEGDFSNPSWSCENPVYGSHIAVDSNLKIYIFSPEDLIPELAIELGQYPCWSPDGSKIAYVYSSNIYITRVFQELN